MNHNVSLSGVILPPPLLNFDGKPRQFGKNRAFDFEKNAPRTLQICASQPFSTSLFLQTFLL
jgi:hypothetical protein